MENYILGINSAYHESSACLIKDGQIIAVVEEERFNRIKHGKKCLIDNPHELPFNSIDFCLSKAGITLNEISKIGFSISPHIRTSHLSDSENNDWGSEEGEKIFNDNLLKIPAILSEHYKVKNPIGEDKNFYFINHHTCHASSAFYPSSFKQSAIVVIDGIGENETASIFSAKIPDQIPEKLFHTFYPHSIGFLWEKLSQYLGFSEYDACKVMGMAAYGNFHNYMKEFNQLVEFSKSYMITINNDIIRFRTNDFSKLENLFGHVREKNQPLEQRHYDIAACLQKVTDQFVMALCVKAMGLTSSKNLCLAGGVFLNCVSNYKILKNKMFENVYIQPATHDAGTAIGAAFYLYNKYRNSPDNDPNNQYMNHAYWGPEYSEEEMLLAAKNSDFNIYYSENPCKKAARLIADGNIVAWFQDRMEIGPRALGNRSLLADPRNPNMRDILNQKVKHREDFRPFAPSVLKEKASEWFEMPATSRSTDFMLFSFPAIKNKQALIPAVIHTDKTARVQTVDIETNPKFHELISEFEAITGVPMLLNTSFNDSEPIVCSPVDAVNTFKKTKIDYLFLGNYFLKRNHE